MAFKNLFIKTKRSFGVKDGFTIKLDSYLEETHSSNISITSNPVELGAEINDHATIEPKEVSMTVVVTDTPLGVEAFKQIVSTTNDAFGSSTKKNLTRSQQAYKDMIKLQTDRVPIQIQTKLQLYENMIITSIECTQDKDSSFIALMTITAKEIIVVDTKTYKIEKAQVTEETGKGARSTEDKGNKETKKPSPSAEKTWLKASVDFGKALFK